MSDSAREIEKNLLGWTLEKPDCVEKVHVDDFESERHRTIFKEFQRQFKENSKIDIFIASEKIGGNGIVAYLSSLTGGLHKSSFENFELYINELRKKRLTKNILAKIERQAKEGSFSLDEIKPELTEIERIIKPRFDISTALKTGSELQALDVDIEWLIEGLIPEKAITMLHGRGGLGKTFLCLQLGKAVAENQNFLSLQTKKTGVVYIDYENSLPLLIDRIRKMEINDVMFWHLSAELKPPRLDSDEYKHLFELPAESLLIFDSLRAVHLGDENSSKDMALVMGRLKELREERYTILVNHHTGKADDRIYKGSTAISDLADHVLGFNKVRKKDFEIIDDDQEPGPGDFYRLGTREKTRFEPFHIYLHFAPGCGFVKADDPDEDDLQQLKEIIGMKCLCQNEIFEVAREGLGIKKKGRIVSLLNKGEKRLWHSYRDGRKVIYEVI